MSVPAATLTNFFWPQPITGQSLPILLNIMFHTPMKRFQLELIIIIPIFPPSSHPTDVCFFLQAQARRQTSTHTRPVENAVLTTKSSQERNTQLLEVTMVEK
jgi:hypothetical protein